MKNKKISVPDWYGKFPFEPDKKKPKLLRQEDAIHRIYGKEPHQIATHLHISTDLINCADFSISPGGHFEPPDIHSGDEVYYILEGVATVFNPEDGKVYTAKEGDVFLVPKGVWHQVFNFTDNNLVILTTIAPKLWSDEDRGMSIEFTGVPAYYGARNEK
ncbi:MAG: cupin domain-containing protein [Candidatus Firestonebacteria bacterium]